MPTKLTMHLHVFLSLGGRWFWVVECGPPHHERSGHSKTPHSALCHARAWVRGRGGLTTHETYTVHNRTYPQWAEDVHGVGVEKVY